MSGGHHRGRDEFGVVHYVDKHRQGLFPWCHLERLMGDIWIDRVVKAGRKQPVTCMVCTNVRLGKRAG